MNESIGFADPTIPAVGSAAVYLYSDRVWGRQQANSTGEVSVTKVNESGTTNVLANIFTVVSTKYCHLC